MAFAIANILDKLKPCESQVVMEKHWLYSTNWWIIVEFYIHLYINVYASEQMEHTCTETLFQKQYNLQKMYSRII